MPSQDTLQRYTILLSGCLFCLDQVLKHLAHSHQQYTYYIVDTVIGWEFFINRGIAFGISFPLPLLVLLTPILLYIFFRTHHSISSISYIGFSILCAGALSNLMDRALFGYVVDYLRIITSLFNLADVYILIGALLLLQQHRKKVV